MDIQRINALLSLEPTAVRENRDQVREGFSFGDVLANAIRQVEQDQRNANEMAIRLAAGEVEDIAQVMIASERASLSLNLAIQVRNKVIEAYQEIMRMTF
ncbi:flagellar hook-basal body complex protein FliE [Symbiobacterium thermophilum]|jgi:flagellar hook-basal body complex protein FliE|uniref:Flagellar hook-basal body complex protein FliE n=1 Tax=Symbiobacterium thermophilum TaxID=2734 RepID=A0A953I9C5_SYMTR|nr:flagellar hook-basal body complex protein FliE [Symbiobacterium thermophilum]MBY6276434.1 flagellar hook-basal body complex protein FliE [Symbiobacterium thermophilum]